ncbi:MAG: hypothetical protein Tsb0013_20830 [Phycisphaerales bacterium]
MQAGTIGVLALLFASAAHAGPSLRTVAFAEDHYAFDAVPGFRVLSTPYINDLGAVAFSAGADVLSEAGTLEFSYGIWVDGPDGAQIAIGEHDFPALEAPEITRTFGLVNFNNVGALAIVSTENAPGPGGITDSLWLDNANGLTHIAREGDPMPSGDGVIDRVSRVSMNAHSDLLLTLHPQGGSTSRASLWEYTGGSFAPRVLPGAPSTGVDGIPLVGAAHYVYNDAGEAAFRGLLDTDHPSVGFDSNDVMVRSSRDGATGVSREGDFAPGYEALPFSSMRTPGMNNAGRLAFAAYLSTDSGVPFRSANGLFVDDGDGVRVIIGANTPVPGRPGRVFVGADDVIVNGRGDVVFIGGDDSPADFYPGGDIGVFRWRDDAIEPIATAGDTPLADHSVVITDFLEGLSSNARGDIVMEAVVGSDAPGMSFSHEHAIVAYDALAENLVQIVRTGMLFDVGTPGAPDLRTITRIEFATGSGMQDGRARGLNESGEIAFYLEFDDFSSGVFVATIPTPGGAVPCIIALALTRRRRS